MDNLDAPARIYTFCTRLRALCGVSRVVVRVHSGAWKRAAAMRFERAPLSGVGSDPWQHFGNVR
jgi:hypothetical protein